MAIEVPFPTYYGGRSVAVLSPRGRFLSSQGTGDLGHTKAHPSYWTVAPCGSGVGLQDGAGNWLALVGENSGLVREVAVVNASEVDCKGPTPPASFVPKSAWNRNKTNGMGLRETALFQGQPAAGGGKHWYLVADTVGGCPDCVEGVVAVASTPAEAEAAGERVRWHVSLQQSCQPME
jgi:hypothetical protein